MKKILVITDSLGLPRPAPEVVEYEQTWVYMLSQQSQVWQHSSGGSTIRELYSQIEYFKMFNPDIVIIQSGIVDCAPRAMSKFENEFINKVWLTKKLAKKFLKEKTLNFLRRKRSCFYTSAYDYEKFVNLFKKAFSDKLYWVGIVPANAGYEKKIPGITLQIEKYNKILNRNLSGKFINSDNLTEKDVMSDFIHLTVSGHLSVFENIKKQILK